MAGLDVLRQYDIVYLASPYTRYKGGDLDAACDDVCKVAASLIQAGIKVFCPIAHSHAISTRGGIDPLSHDIWLEQDEPFMKLADALLVVELDGWSDSYGVSYEDDIFSGAGKPIHHLDPITMEVR